MINEKHMMRGAVLALAVGLGALGYNQTRARADGIPATRPLTYAGTLEEGGAPVNGMRNLRLTLWDSATSTESVNTRCITTVPGAMVSNGRFQVVLDAACAGVVRSTPDLWLEIEVNGGSLGRTKLSAVPFAVEANRAAGLTPLASNALIPTGTIVAFGGTVDRVPEGWLPCDGRVLTRAMYSGLFDAIGTAHGGDGTRFNLPDLRGRFLRGVDGEAGRDPDRMTRTAANMGGNAGNAVGSAQARATAMPNAPFVNSSVGDHNHDFPRGATWAGTDRGRCAFLMDCSRNGFVPAEGPNPGGAHNHSITGGDAETRPVNVAVNYIIKL
jgi:hypothetical protein